MTPARDCFAALLQHKRPKALMTPDDFQSFNPSVLPDNAARALVESGEADAGVRAPAKDMFGVQWVYVPAACGSMPARGKPLLDDAHDWERVVCFPDVKAWDWQGCARKNAAWLDGGKVRISNILNGFFERLISLMGMENALISMVDEDCAAPLNALFDRLADLYIAIIGHMRADFGTDVVLLHDDWGYQQAAFFPRAVIERLIAPPLYRVVRAAKALGMAFELHSCGRIDPLVPVMVDCGVDIWRGQPINDMERLYRQYGSRIVLQFEAQTSADMTRDALVQRIGDILQAHPRGDYLLAPPCMPNASQIIKEESRRILSMQ